MHEAALRLVQPLLNDLSHHFRRFCRTSAMDYFGLLRSACWKCAGGERSVELAVLTDKAKLTHS